MLPRKILLTLKPQVHLIRTCTNGPLFRVGPITHWLVLLFILFCSYKLNHYLCSSHNQRWEKDRKSDNNFSSSLPRKIILRNTNNERVGDKTWIKQKRERWKKSLKWVWVGTYLKLVMCTFWWNGGKRSMWTRTLREVSECIRRYHSLTLAHVVGDVPSMSYKLI